MKSMNYWKLLAGILVASFAMVAFNCQAAEKAASKAAAKTKVAHEKVLIQVSDDDPKKWNLALNNAKNVQDALGARNVTIEIVAYGPGIGMLKLDSEVGSRIDQAKEAGVKVVACENTMQKQKLTKQDMLPSAGYVPAGVVELIKKQHEGYAYLRP